MNEEDEKLRNREINNKPLDQYQFGQSALPAEDNNQPVNQEENKNNQDQIGNF